MAPAETTVRDREAAGRPLPAPGGLRRPASAFCQAWKGDDRGARGRLWDEGRRPPFRDVRPTAGDGDRGGHGEARDFRGQGAALLAARTAAPHHLRLLLLAGQPGALAVLPAAGCLWTQDRLCLA